MVQPVFLFVCLFVFNEIDETITTIIKIGMHLIEEVCFMKLWFWLNRFIYIFIFLCTESQCEMNFPLWVWPKSGKAIAFFHIMVSTIQWSNPRFMMSPRSMVYKLQGHSLTIIMAPLVDYKEHRVCLIWWITDFNLPGPLSLPSI